MGAATQAVEQEDYRMALVLPSSKLILAVRDLNSLRLPRVSIPKWTRPAEQIKELISQEWGMPSIVIDFLEGQGQLPTCVVAELSRSHPVSRQQAFQVVDIDAIDATDLSIAENRTVRNILMGRVEDRGPFSRVEWIEEAKQWIRSNLPGSTIEFLEDVRQFNASATFALVRLGTREGPAYWLKATGKPNDRECVVTATLARLFPQHLPTLVAAREDWNAWVMQEVGVPLSSSLTLPALEQAVSGLAELQIRSAAHISELLSVGCFDQRTAVLEAHVDELIAFLEDVMASQTSTKVSPLDRCRLQEIGCLLKDAFSRMEEIQIPDALIHGDINSGNILFDGKRCVFIDWAEAYIGNPFSTFQQLYVQVARERNANEWCPRMKSLYKRHWRDILAEPQVECAFALAPLLAIASCFYGRGTWLTSARCADPRFQSYARSIGRYMDRAARAPELREALCQ